jgi:hypothetical protein
MRCGEASAGSPLPHHRRQLAWTYYVMPNMRLRPDRHVLRLDPNFSHTHFVQSRSLQQRVTKPSPPRT